MFVIGEAVIDDAAGRASFCCDLQGCKGACCTLPGGRGAPLEDDEVKEIAKAFPAARQFLDHRSLRAIDASGLTEGSPGDFATPCLDQRECVFVFFEDGVAKCSFERAFERGLTGWRKPMSCHLFPIRISHFGRDFVRYEQIDECAPGRKRGEQENVPLRDFLREPLIRRYGEAWYRAFLEYCATHAKE
ncbi:MAG TPA: DUF3109 family protein [Bacteroidota bacterium]|nr:DUF3109 family protein [Bacteroidota bacterium]